MHDITESGKGSIIYSLLHYCKEVVGELAGPEAVPPLIRHVDHGGPEHFHAVG